MPLNNNIYEGLRNALSRGYSLKQAMLGFHNAGYKKEEIEEAARALHEHPSHPLSHPQKQIPTELAKTTTKNILSKPSIPQPVQTSQQQTPMSQSAIQKPIQTPSQSSTSPNQVVSKYGEDSNPKPKASPWIIVIIIVLFFVLLGLVGSLLFREEIMNFINNLF